MRHGRKSKSKRIDGYQCHVATDLDSTAILACALTPANRPEHEALPMLKQDIEGQGIGLNEAHFDRGYMGSPAVGELAAGGTEIICKPWRSRNGEWFTKEDFRLDLRSMTITCPGGWVESIQLGRTVEFDSAVCDRCPLREQCTKAALGHGRMVSSATDERLQKRLREKGKTKVGRSQFRERVPVEHRLAHIGQRQGPRARYRNRGSFGE